MTYWEKRQKQLNQAMEKDEDKLKKRLSSYYDTEYRKLEKQIASYYQQYGENNVIEYRKLMESLPEDDRMLLIEQMDQFAEKYPQYQHLLPVRESIYKLNRLEGLQTSVRMQQLEMGAVNNEQIKAHLEKQALRGANAAAEAMGFGKNFYSNNSGVIKQFVDVPWANGKDFSQRIWDNTDKLANYLNTNIAQGLARGDSYDRLVRNLRQRFSDVSRNDAYRLIYTEGTYVMAEATIQPFVEDFQKYRVSTVGDGKVCSICRAAATQAFDIKYRRPGVNFPPLHTWCRCTFTIEVDDWDKWMDDYEKKYSREQAETVANRLNNTQSSGIIEPEDKGDLNTGLANLSDNLIESSLQVNNYLNTLGLPESKWSGKTIVQPSEKMGYSIGKKVKSCDIWLRSDATVKTVIHEHLHSRSISRTPEAYGKYHAIEEATVELLSEEICKRNNIGYKRSYRQETNALRNISDILGDEYYTFSQELLSIDVDKRKVWLNEQIEQYKQKHMIKGKLNTNVFETSMSVLFGEDKK